MKEKIKKIIFGYLPGFITGLIVCGGISVIAATYFPSNDVTYDNKASGLNSTNVQGAIDELYEVCTAEKVDVGGIEIPVIDNGDGLYEDEYEDGRYFYKGSDPNNYITFNGEEAGWRIMSFEDDGTIKIMRVFLEKQVWDSSASNNWARPASLNTYLNGTYYNGLNSIAKSQIVAKDWSIGAITEDNNNLAKQINDENSKKWNGKIALATASEYIRGNSNKSSCGSISLLHNNSSSCKNTNWMIESSALWTLSPSNSLSSRSVSQVSKYRGIGSRECSYPDNIRPVLYLSSEIKIIGGTGTKSDPYEISL